MIALTRNFESDDSAADLEAQHLSIAENMCNWQQVWQVIYEHPWFTRQLDLLTRKVVKNAGLKSSEIDDIKQHVLVELAAAIQRQPMLGFDTRKGSYGGFLSTILYRACLKALRQFSQSKDRSYFEDLLHPYYEDQAQREKILDFRHVASQIPDPYRRIVRQLCNGSSIPEIATAEDRSTRTIYRLVERSIDLMQVLYFGRA